MKWVIVLLIYFQNSDRVDISETSYYFDSGIECAKFKSDENFSQILKESFKGKGISLVNPICKPVNYNIGEDKDYVLNNGSKGICQISSCVWN